MTPYRIAPQSTALILEQCTGKTLASKSLFQRGSHIPQPNIPISKSFHPLFIEAIGYTGVDVPLQIEIYIARRSGWSF